MSKTAAATPAATVNVSSPTPKLHRLEIQAKLPNVLTSVLDKPVPSRYAVISRERGAVNVYLPQSYAPSLADFVQSVQTACEREGFDCVIVGTPVAKSNKYELEFTNSLMQEQAGWGSRGNSKQDREFTAMAAAAQQPAAPAVQQPSKAATAKAAKAAKAAAALTLDSSPAAQQAAAAPSSPAKAAKGSKTAKGSKAAVK